MPQLPSDSALHLPFQERSAHRPKQKWLLFGGTFALCLLSLNSSLVYRLLALTSSTRHDAWQAVMGEARPLRPVSPVDTVPDSPSSTPASEPPKDVTALFWENNTKKINELRQCLRSQNCRLNQDRLIITSSHHIMQAVTNHYIGGEEIWAKSLIRAWDALGYTWYHTFNLEAMKDLHEEFRNNTDMILTPDDYAIDCFHNPKCAFDPDTNPRGLPIWKLFSFYFWADPMHPLGGKWTLNPENYSHQRRGGNTYIGYSVEEGCLAHEFIPHSQRSGSQAYVYAKKLSFFAPTRARAYPPSWYEHASQRVTTSRGPLHMIAGVTDDLKDFPDRWPTFKGLPTGIQNYGHMPQSEFMDKVAHSSVLVGVGSPLISPTPYEALCLGVPFINPILRWDKENRTDRDKWDAQHGELKFLDPPYVYNVHIDDKDAFIGALQAALDHPIDRYILPKMHQENVTQRVHDVLTSDWRNSAEEVLANRVKSGKGLIFHI